MPAHVGFGEWADIAIDGSERLLGCGERSLAGASGGAGLRSKRGFPETEGIGLVFRQADVRDAFPATDCLPLVCWSQLVRSGYTTL